MSIRQVIGVSVLLSACVAWVPPAEAAAPNAAPNAALPKRPLVLPVTVRPSGGAAISAECVADFGPPLPISALAFSPDGKTLAVGGYREVLLWDLDKAKLAKRIGTGELAGSIHAVTFLDGGKSLAVGDGVPHQSGAVKIFDPATGKPTATFNEPNREVYCLAVSPDGKLLAAGDAESRVHVWDLATKKLAKTLKSHNGWVLGAAFSPDGKRLATASADKTLRLWDVATWEPVLRYDLPATVHGTAFSPDGKTIVAAVGGEAEWALRIGRIDSDIQQAARRKPRPQTLSTGTGMPLDIAWPAKGTNAFVSCNDNTVRVYAGTRLLATLGGHTDWVYCVASPPDGSKLASGSADGTVKLWSAAAGKPVATTFVHLSPGTDDWLIMTPEGYYTASSDDVVKWREAGSSTPLKEMPGRYNDPEMVRKTVAASKPPAGTTRGKSSSRWEAMRRAFRSADKNRDGKLTKEEAPSRLRQRFDKIDTNGNGSLDIKEFSKAIIAAKRLKK